MHLEWLDDFFYNYPSALASSIIHPSWLIVHITPLELLHFHGMSKF